MRSAGIRLDLRIVGKGPQRKELVALAKAFGIEGNAFLGPVPHAKVPDHLQSFDIYVAASRLDSESFGVAVIEASACGVPVVVSDAGGLPEVVDDGITGLIVKRDSPELLSAALKKLVLNSDLRDRLGQAGRRKVEREYRWSTCVDQMIDVYHTVIQACTKIN